MSSRAVLHLVGTPDAELASAVAELGDSTTVLQRDPDCFHGVRSPFAAALESTDADLLIEIAGSLGSMIDSEQSMAIVGTDHIFIEPIATPVRYQYLMHRRPDFTHEAYLERYRTVHFQFGLRTPNIFGYVQLDVDQDASTELGAATGLLAPPCDSMSELYLESVDHFMEGIVAHPEVGAEAAEDEEHFVDRERSFGFAHRVV